MLPLKTRRIICKTVICNASDLRQNRPILDWIHHFGWIKADFWQAVRNRRADLKMCRFHSNWFLPRFAESLRRFKSWLISFKLILSNSSRSVREKQHVSAQYITTHKVHCGWFYHRIKLAGGKWGKFHVNWSGSSATELYAKPLCAIWLRYQDLVYLIKS